MRVVFMGSAEIACPALGALLDAPSVDVVGVVTQPDRPKGRRLKLAPCAVKAFMANYAVPLLSPDNINTLEAMAELRSLNPDLVVVAAYGQILRAEALGIPPLGYINIHTSLLPLYRGAAPIQWSIANGDAETGITIMRVDEGMDTGDIIAQRSVVIGDRETGGMLHDRLAKVGAELLLEVIDDIAAGSVTCRKQDENQATFAPKLSKSDGKIDWTQSARDLYNRIRAFNPWPCCTCLLPDSGDQLRILMANVEHVEGSPGEVLDVKGDGPLIACGSDGLRLIEVQPQGKRPMSGSAYLCGHALQLGDVLT